jgi:ketosteroid isomerase-like protein
MAGENLAFVRSVDWRPGINLARAFRSIDVPPGMPGIAAAAVHEDFAFEFVGDPTGMLDAEGPFEGPDGLATALRIWTRAWDSWRRYAAEHLEIDPDTVFVEVTYSGAPKGGGTEISTDGAEIWRFSDGRLISLRSFLDARLARREVGLPERS